MFFLVEPAEPRRMNDIHTNLLALRHAQGKTAYWANQSSSARTFTVLPFTLPVDNLRTASRAISRVTAT